ncbi:MAG TPA: carboxylating nicotinate-nucleotide diphosphorylase [Gammaproteobacteria bacterium]|nr:carboxylating nicotinate-nucleotide diphosphorylase [Gammaproteobacteria bacterium]
MLNNSTLETVRLALAEDLGDGDLTAALIPVDTCCEATVICREYATICGKTWFNNTFEQLSDNIMIHWQVEDGDQVEPDQVLCQLYGPARELLSGERTALNFLQTLSATATCAQTYADIVSDLPVKLLDTRKTIPGLRLAQKYAVTCGNCFNHRTGLYDGILIKENHIMACGSIAAAVDTARRTGVELPIEVEVENLDEVQQALDAEADILLLDNFTIEQLNEAVALNQGQAQLEASGNVSIDTLRSIAETGVHYISIGLLTKDIRAIDLSMRFKSL